MVYVSIKDQLMPNAGQNYFRMQMEHSAILSTFIKLPVAIKTIVLSFLSDCFTQVLLYLEGSTNITVRRQLLRHINIV